MADKETFPRCTHPYRCKCAGGVESYRLYYSQLLRAVKPARIFEWGPGPNSQMALELKTTKQVVSVEQDKKWIPDIRSERQAVIHLQANSPMYTGACTDIFGCSGFDLFFVDSRRRAECLDVVWDLAPLEAVVCLHDAQRCRYHDSLAKFRFVHFPNNGFAMATGSSDQYEIIKKLGGYEIIRKLKGASNE